MDVFADFKQAMAARTKDEGDESSFYSTSENEGESDNSSRGMLSGDGEEGDISRDRMRGGSNEG